MTKAFNFESGGRKYVCTVEMRKTPPTGNWWWFAVSDDQQRYAPFETATGDSEKSVQKRIVAYYENLLEVRARPVEARQHWAQRGRPAKQVQQP